VLDRKDLLPYQNHAVEWSKPRPNNAKWIDMGLGKTVIEATVFADLQRDMEVKRMLVIAPKRVARRVWSDEVKEWKHLNHLSVSRIVGTADECFEAMRTKADIHTIGRERIPWLKAQFLDDNGKLKYRWPWDVVTIDESQSFKSQSSQRWKALTALRPYFPRLAELSGTPSPNGYGDLWSQFSLLDKGRRLGSSERSFQERWFTPPVGMFTKWKLSQQGELQIRDAIKDLVLSLKESHYLDLPPILSNFIRVTLSPAAMRTYKEMEREYIAEVAGKKLTAVNAGVLDGKLLQLANGACYHAKGEWVEFHSAKTEALDETLESLPGKVLISYAYQHDLVRIQKVCAKRAREDSKTWAVLKTDASLDAWSRGEIDWGVLHPASAGHGLNEMHKSGCEDIIHFGLMNNLEHYQQVNARIGGGHRRAGKNVRVHHIVADGTRDDDYVRLIKQKALTQDGLTEGLAVKMQ
jgi:SNF2 family DNA or RNA helicase